MEAGELGSSQLGRTVQVSGVVEKGPFSKNEWQVTGVLVNVWHRWGKSNSYDERSGVSTSQWAMLTELSMSFGESAESSTVIVPSSAAAECLE
jgi:hypothetical protein